MTKPFIFLAGIGLGIYIDQTYKVPKINVVIEKNNEIFKR